jgi:hypothetical protein
MKYALLGSLLVLAANNAFASNTESALPNPPITCVSVGDTWGGVNVTIAETEDDQVEVVIATKDVSPFGKDPWGSGSGSSGSKSKELIKTRDIKVTGNGDHPFPIAAITVISTNPDQPLHIALQKNHFGNSNADYEGHIMFLVNGQSQDFDLECTR